MTPPREVVPVPRTWFETHRLESGFRQPILEASAPAGANQQEQAELEKTLRDLGYMA